MRLSNARQLFTKFQNKLSQIIDTFRSQNYLGNYEESIKNYNAAIPMLRGNNSELCRCYGGLGWISGDHGDIQGALENYKVALALAREVNDKEQEGIQLGAIGTHTWQQGNVNDAIKYFNEAVELSRSVKDRRREGTRTYNLGTILRHVGNYSQSYVYLYRALDIAESNRDSRLQGIIHGIIGECHTDLGNYEKAISEQELGLNILRDIKYSKYLVFAEVGLGESLLMMKDFDNAKNQLFRGREIANKAKLPQPQLTSSIAIARLFLHSNKELRKALKYAIEASIFQIPLYDYFPHLLIGIIHSILGDKPDSIIAFNKAIEKANILLNKSPNLYRAMFAKSMALAGLAVTSDSKTSNKVIRESLQTFSKASKICSETGIINDTKMILDEIVKVDRQSLLSEYNDLLEISDNSN